MKKNKINVSLGVGSFWHESPAKLPKNVVQKYPFSAFVFD